MVVSIVLKSFFGETKDISCKCLFKNTVIVQFGSIYGLCIHKEVIIVDIYNSSFEYIKIFFILCKMVIGLTFLSLK